MSRFKYKYPRPTPAEFGQSRSKFKSKLKRMGFDVPKDFFGYGCYVADRRGLRFRFRYWGDTYSTSPKVFLVDIAARGAFDRWAVSCKETITLAEFMERFG